MIKLVVSDMDGTLLDGNGNIPSEFWDLLPRLKEKGILFAVASGRQHATLKDFFQQASQDIIFIADNGGLVEYQNQILFLDEMPKTDLGAMIALTDAQKDSHFLISGKNSAYIAQSSVKVMQEFQNYFNVLHMVEDLEKVNDHIIKMCVYNPHGTEKNNLLDFKKFEDKYTITPSGYRWLDITNLTSDKGQALEKIKQKFDISDDEVMIFGDHMNDLSMMKQGKYSYAMQNAHPELKKQASFITKLPNTEYGVIETIKEYVNSL